MCVIIDPSVSLILSPDLELFALVVEVAVHRHSWLRLPLEERVVELLVVDVYLAELRPDLLPLLGLHPLLTTTHVGFKEGKQRDNQINTVNLI